MFKELLEKVAKSLSDADIPYMIIGGQAVILYGEPRLTRDIDITLGFDDSKLSDILEIIKKIPLKPIPEDISQFVKKTMVLPALDESTKIRVDFIFSFTPYEQEAINRAKKIQIGQTEVNFASAEDTIIHKIFAHRPRDIEDVKSIILKNHDLDRNYLKKWLSEFDKSFPEEKFLEILNDLLT